MTYSIANGLAFGFVTFVLLKVATGRRREVHWMMYVLTLLFIVRFLYLGGVG